MKWVGLKPIVTARKHWRHIDGKLSYFEVTLPLEPWRMQLRVVVYRKRVFHETRKYFQLDLFSPDDGHFEYSAITTNKTLGGTALWQFMAGRGAQEKTIAELKGEFALDVVPTRQYGANSAWQLISVLAFNLMRGFQVSAAAYRRPFAARRRPLFALANIQTLRYELLHQAGLLLHPDGRPTLEIGPSPAVKKRFLELEAQLPRAA